MADSADYAALLASLKTDLLQIVENDILPMIVSAAKQAASTAGGPVAALVADPVIDIVDSYVLKMLGTPAPANAQPAPTDTQSQITAIAKHVAALTVATGNATSATVASKVTLPTLPVVQAGPTAATAQKAA